MSPCPRTARLAAIWLTLTALTSGAVEPGPEILLWPQGAPGSEGRTAPEKVTTGANGDRTITSVHRTSITPYLPEQSRATGAAVLVIPGGGHAKLCVTHEGENVAHWLAEHGVAAFVLKYRLAREEGSTYTILDHAVPDAERALRTIRARAHEWAIGPGHVGAIGFSAGGELVGQAAMHVQGAGLGGEGVDRQSARPSFQALIYPGRSADLLPGKDAPPAFMVCGEKDRPDIAEGLPEAYLRFKRAGVSAELHVYAGVGHGFGYRPGMKGPVGGWIDRFYEWLGAGGFLTRAKE